MIGSLRGQLIDNAGDGEVMIEVAGVGYRVFVLPAAAASLALGAQEAFIFTHHHIREDAESLFGFLSSSERRCFELLLASHGVGPSLAMAILSVHDPISLGQIVAAGDAESLCLVSGVGKKTAARLLVELKNRLDAPPESESSGEGSIGPNTVLADVREALAGLGYGPEEIRDAIRENQTEGDVATILKSVLQQMAGASR